MNKVTVRVIGLAVAVAIVVVLVLFAKRKDTHELRFALVPTLEDTRRTADR